MLTHKNFRKKGLSILLAAVLMLTGLSYTRLGTLAVAADGSDDATDTTPSIETFATKEQLEETGSDLYSENVLFASTAPAATVSKNLGEVMIPRLDGSNVMDAIISCDSSEISVRVKSMTPTMYLYVQGRDASGDWIYSRKIEGYNTTTNSGHAGADLSQCKVWLEMQDDDGLVYAKMAGTSVKNVNITGIEPPTAGKALDTTAVCTTQGVLTTNPTVTYQENGNAVSGTAGYLKTYTATITLQTDMAQGYYFSTWPSVKINGTGGASYTYDKTTDQLIVTYTFAQTGKKSLGNAYYVTTEDLLDCFDLDGNDDTLGQIYFGTTTGEDTSGTTPLRWYIAGTDRANATQNIVLYAAQSLGESALNDSEWSYEYSGSTLAATLAGYEYGTGSNANAKFTSAEDGMMLYTTLQNNSVYTDNSYTAKSPVKLYALNRSGDYITAGANDTISIEKTYWNSAFWLRDRDTYVNANSTLTITYDTSAQTVFPVVVAFDLDISNVLFASATPAATEINAKTTGTDSGFALAGSTPVYTLRWKDTGSKIASTAVYDTNSVTVTKNGSGALYLYVQDADSVYAKQITETTTINLADMTGIDSLTDDTTHIWLETTEDNLTYAKEATLKQESNSPADPKPSENKGPSIVGDNGTTGWNAISEKLDKVLSTLKNQAESTGAAQTVTVDMNGTTTVPGDILTQIKGENVTVAFDMGNGIVWKVNGKDVTADNIKDINLGVSKNTKNIPVDIINNVTGERTPMQISLDYNGNFGFKATMSINMDVKNAGLYANLFYYNPDTEQLEFMNYGKIAADGSVDLTFTHASDYAIVVDTKPLDGSANDTTDPGNGNPDNTALSPKTGESSDYILGYLLLLVTVGGVSVLTSIKKKKQI